MYFQPATLTASPGSRSIVTTADAGPSQGLTGVPSGGVALDSSSLLRGRKAITIVHNGSNYRLQTTKLGKLILTK